MNKAINFYELKEELAHLGFRDPEVTDHLRQAVYLDSGEHHLQAHLGNVAFDLDLIRDGHHRLSFIGYSGSLGAGTSNWQLQSFHPDVPASEAATLLTARATRKGAVEDISLIPIGRPEIAQYIESIPTTHEMAVASITTKHEIMNVQNLEFLKKSLLNLGFGDKVNGELEQQIGNKVPEFKLGAKHEFNQTPVDYTLHFKAGDTDGMYFFNKFDATLNQGKDKETNQTFYINKGNGITAKEAFNLMEGRAVHKLLFNKESEKYHAWLQLDPEKLNENGNKEIKRFNENYGFDLDKVLLGKGIKELNTQETAENLMRSLKKGNLQQITVERNGEEKKFFISASPQYKTVDLYDHQMKRIKREELLQPSQKASNTQKQNRQQKEGLPEKKQQSRKRKMTV